MKYSKLLFGFITVIGLIFVTMFLVNLYLDYYLSQNLLLELFPSFFLRGLFGYLLFFGGPIFLIVGMLGIGKYYFEDEYFHFAVLIVDLVPLLLSVFMVLLAYFAPLTIAF